MKSAGRTKATCRKIRDSRLKEQKKAIKNSTALSLLLLQLVKCCMLERPRRHSHIMPLLLYVMFSARRFPISIFAPPPTLHRHTRSPVFMRWNVSCIGKESAQKAEGMKIKRPVSVNFKSRWISLVWSLRRRAHLLFASWNTHAPASTMGYYFYCVCVYSVSAFSSLFLSRVAQRNGWWWRRWLNWNERAPDIKISNRIIWTRCCSLVYERAHQRWRNILSERIAWEINDCYTLAFSSRSC
jgi:hypothetical protein